MKTKSPNDFLKSLEVPSESRSVLAASEFNLHVVTDQYDDEY